MTGEAYFEIAKNANLPFIVQKGDMNIRVLGTHFNVKAYDDDEAMKATLLEGKIAISRGRDKGLLIPGQQAMVGKEGGNFKVVNNSDIEEVTAWKNGIFKFDDADIETVMRQLERWYDVDVVFETKVSQHFVADIPKNEPLSETLKLLELTGQVHFEIQGKKVIVTR